MADACKACGVLQKKKIIHWTLIPASAVDTTHFYYRKKSQNVFMQLCYNLNNEKHHIIISTFSNP